MAKKQTFQQRLVAFAYTATDDELNAALDTLKAFKETRSPKQRKPRTRTQTSTTAALAAGEVSSSGN